MNQVKDDNDILQRHGVEALDPEQGLVEATALDASKTAVAELRLARIERCYDEAVDRMFARVEGREVPIRLPWNSVNRALGGGFWPGLHVLVAASGVGKSQWALQTTEAACTAGIPVLYIGLELDKMALVARLLGIRAHCQWSGLYLGNDHLNLKRATRNHGGSLVSWPLYIDVSPPMGWHYDELHRKTKALRTLHPKGSCLIVLDYLQLVTGDKRDDLRERIRQASYAARAAARDCNASILLISSVAREHYPFLTGQRRINDQGPGQGNPARFLGVGKESGEIEYAADSVLVLGHDGNIAVSEGGSSPRTVHLGIAKLRAGATQWISLIFDGNRFFEPKDVADYEQPTI